MNIISGIVSRVRHASEINGSGADSYQFVSTTHISLIELRSGERVRYASGEPAFISEGDRVSFACERSRGGYLRARAYRNDTARVSGDDRSHWYALCFGVLFALLCPVGALLALAPGHGEFIAVLIFAAGVAGVVIAAYGVRTWKSIRSVVYGGEGARQSFGLGGVSTDFLK